MKIYCQGKILPAASARISANDHGFLYGATLFETFRTYRGEPFLLEKHLARIRSGCRAFGIEIHADLLVHGSGLRDTVLELLRQNNLPDAVFRYTISAGEAPPGPPASPWRQATDLLFVRPPPPPPDRAAIDLHLLTTPRTEPEILPRRKSGHFMNAILALRELRQRNPAPDDEGLLLTRDGYLSEGTTSNIFLVSGNSILTPSEEAHILRGIRRDHVLGRARSLGFSAAETDLFLADLIDAEAGFITNSVRGIVPFNRLLDPTGNVLWQANSAEHETIRKLRAE